MKNNSYEQSPFYQAMELSGQLHQLLLQKGELPDQEPLLTFFLNIFQDSELEEGKSDPYITMEWLGEMYGFADADPFEKLYRDLQTRIQNLLLL